MSQCVACIGSGHSTLSQRGLYPLPVVYDKCVAVYLYVRNNSYHKKLRGLITHTYAALTHGRRSRCRAVRKACFRLVLEDYCLRCQPHDVRSESDTNITAESEEGTVAVVTPRVLFGCGCSWGF